MNSNVITRRYDRTFDLLDHDGNGVLEEKDFTGLTEAIARATGVPQGSAKEETLLKEWRNCWHTLLELADANGDGEISREEFQQAMAEAYGDHAKLKERLTPGLEASFAAIDADDDEVATVEQYEVYLTAWGLEPAQARAARGLLDADGDGRFTCQEFVNGWTEFLLGEDAEGSVGALLGPLN
ncbi:EF-hand domain-containing protein [Streptomyces canus]|uniref:EF-hand domain-containing protein n=1 Tax=Streptomyces canus TaxID=58343 RepID=UPI00224DA144|nr:EF-hand domain-containing protein [Streptomyces canus]MCX4856239.1 EF-hand domain-containing protein [Streptomyces canus]WSW38292.1 EF-hand domain-containing protein [Streptomyces canus]